MSKYDELIEISKINLKMFQVKPEYPKQKF